MGKLDRIFSLLVHPSMEEEPGTVQGTEVVPAAGNLFEMLAAIFLKAETECDIPIRFLSSASGQQENDTRTDLIELIRTPSLPLAVALGQRLQIATPRISGLGLLFILLGRHNDDHRVVLSRFPANQGVLAEAAKGQLEIEFVERVFMKSASTYKAAHFRGQSLKADFWNGKVIDRQFSGVPSSVANYWVKGFLHSDFRTTSRAGSRNLGLALRNAAKGASNVDIKHEIVALATLAPRLEGRKVSPDDLIERFSLSDEAAEQIRNRLPNRHVSSEPFLFDAGEFRKHVAFRSVELDNSAVLSAPVEDFDKAFRTEVLDNEGHRVRFTSEGKIVDERVRTRK